MEMKIEMEMRKRRLIILLGISALLSGCGQRGGEKTMITVTETAGAYETLSYGEWKRQTGLEAEFYQGTLFLGKIPDSSLEVVYRGAYDENAAAAVLSEETEPLRIQGPLGQLMDGMDSSMSLTDLTEALSPDGAAEAILERFEGGGTGYYVGNQYVQVQFDSDRDGTCDRRLSISLDGSEGETVDPESAAWLEKEQENS